MIKDFIYVHKNAIENTFKNLKNLPGLWIHLFLYALVFTLVSRLISAVFGGMVFGGGILRALTRAALFSHLLYTLESIVDSNRIYWSHLNEGFTKYMSQSISVFFGYWVIELISSFLYQAAGSLPAIVFIIIELSIFLIFAGAAEYIYIAGTYSYDSINASANLMVDEPLNWTLFNLVLFILLRQVGVDLDIYRMVITPDIRGLLQIAVIGIYLIYRGNLFKELYMSNRRKREYMR